MCSFPHPKFNSGIGFAIMANGNETIDFSQLPSMASASISKMHLTKSTTPTTMIAPRSIEGGRENPFRTGDNSPQSLAVFLRPQFFDSSILSRRFNIMMVCVRQSLRLVSPVRGILTLARAVTNTVRSIGVGYPTLRTGITDEN
jgi:hypothetical protein